MSGERWDPDHPHAADYEQIERADPSAPIRCEFFGGPWHDQTRLLRRDRDGLPPETVRVYLPAGDWRRPVLAPTGRHAIVARTYSRTVDRHRAEGTPWVYTFDLLGDEDPVAP